MFFVVVGFFLETMECKFVQELPVKYQGNVTEKRFKELIFVPIFFQYFYKCYDNEDPWPVPKFRVWYFESICYIEKAISQYSCVNKMRNIQKTALQMYIVFINHTNINYQSYYNQYSSQFNRKILLH